MLSLGYGAHRKRCHDSLGFTPGKELAQLVERGPRQSFKRAEMTQERVSERICLNY